jgi:hypothetical protein
VQFATLSFSCKKRGFCPSCSAKRKAETAIHLTENVLPLIPYRQYVVTLPFPMRYWLHTNRKLRSHVHKTIIRHIHRLYTEKAKAQGLKDPISGSISFTQRFSSSLALNLHWHILVADGVYITNSYGEPRFREVTSITDDDIATLLDTISQKVIRYLQRKGYLDQDQQVVDNPALDPLFADHPSLVAAADASIRNRIAFGPNAGQKVRKIGSGFGYLEEIPLAKGHLCYSVNGFSLHAATAVKALQRERLKQLVEYIARGPISNERLEITDEREVRVKLKSAWHDGTTHILLSFSEYLEKIASIIPPPRSHLVVWSGFLAPNHPMRKKVTLDPERRKGFQFRRPSESQDGSYLNCAWSEMLKRVFKIDVEICQNCGGKLRRVCAVTDLFQIRRYLKHIGEGPDPPYATPARLPQYSEVGLDLQYDDTAGSGSGSCDPELPEISLD